MKITQLWKRNTPTTDGYGLTVTYVYSSKYLHEIEDVERKLPMETIFMDTDKPKPFFANAEYCKQACSDCNLTLEECRKLLYG